MKTTNRSGSTSSRASYMRIADRMFACVSMQPFGGPVVPDV